MSNHLSDATKMVDRIPCEKCGEFHTVEVNVATFQGVINKCSELQARVKELESLLAKEEHARSQANFAVVLLQERLKELKELEEWKRKAVRFLEMIKQRDYWNADLYKSDYKELETLLEEEATHETH